MAVLCGSAGVPGAVGSDSSGRAAWCARGRRPARSPSALRASLGASSRSPARPRHRPPAPRQVPPAPSTPAAQPEFAIQRVACGTVGVPGAVGPGRCVCRWAAARPLAVRAASLRLGASSRSPARPCHRPPAPRQLPPAPSTPVAPGVLMTIHIIAEPTPNSACNSPTTLSNPEIRSLELQRFLTLLKLHPIELHATFLRQAPPPPTCASAWSSGPSGALRTGGAAGIRD